MDNNSTPSLPDLVLPSVVTTLSLPSKHAAADMRLPQAWLLRSVPDEENRSAASGKVYDDALEFRYVYDSKVPNHKNVREGDFVLIRDNSILLGSAVIRKIESYEADKVMTYCPTCGSTRITFKSDGLWRCDGKCLRRDNLKPEQRLHKNPPQKTETVQRFIAYYGDTWTELIGAADKDSFKDLSVPGKYNTQNSIVALDTAKVLDWLESLNTSGIHLLPLGDAHGVPMNPRGGFTMRTVRARVGQGQFRQELLNRFGNMCAFTGACHTAALDAAHLYSYAREGEHRVDEGLLLRKDLHKLFDSELVGVSSSRTLLLHPGLGNTQYQSLAGARLKVELPNRALELLDEHRSSLSWLDEALV
ncbi:HNH endonuclease [Rothia aeria]|uniref:HNH endonuclease n=1 Tax=Rothia aeria TaxID=172042 RepID=UPI0028E71922|nr:HNH endonuclease [Rothia aeria]